MKKNILLLLLAAIQVFAWQPYELYTWGPHSFKVDPTLASKENATPEEVLQNFLNKGGTFCQTPDPFIFNKGDLVFPVCSVGKFRSQSLLQLLKEFDGSITLFAPHAARYGWDPYDGKLHFREYPAPKVNVFFQFFGTDRVERFGFENSDQWFQILENPSRANVEMLTCFYNENYYGLKTESRRVYIAFSANAHVVMHRLSLANESLENVVLLSCEAEDFINHPLKEWNCEPRTFEAFEKFYEFLKGEFNVSCF